jgi:hypothetical protein
MAFDLSTAKEEGFDLSTAKPDKSWAAKAIGRDGYVWDALKGGAEAGLNLAGGVGGMLVAPVAAGMHTVDQAIKGEPTSFEKDYASIMGHAGSLGTQLADATGLRSSTGDTLNEGISTLINQVGIPAMGIHGIPSINTGLKQAMPELTTWPNLQPRPGMEPGGKPSVADVISKAKGGFDLSTAKEFVPEKMNETAQYELFDQPEMGRVANPYEAKLGDWRVDENGIPIKADLTMDAQNAAQPLQRNLWGDELPQTRNPVGQNADLFAPEGMQEGVPLPEAIDAMPWAQRRGAINSRLAGDLEAPGNLEAAKMQAEGPGTPGATLEPINRLGAGGKGIGGKQGGAIDVAGVQEALSKLKAKLITGPEALKAFRGAFDPTFPTESGWKNAVEDSTDPKSRGRLVWMSPDDFLEAAQKRHEDYLSGYGAPDENVNTRRASIREGLKSREGLDNLPRFTIDGGKINGHNGRHRMDVFKELGIEKVPVYVRDSVHRVEDGPLPYKHLITENGTKIPLPEDIFPTEKLASWKDSQRGGVDIKSIEDGFDSIRKTISKLNPADRATRAVNVSKHLNSVADEISSEVPNISKILRRKDVSEITDHIVEAQTRKDSIQYWQEMLAGVTEKEDPTIGGQLRSWGRVKIRQAKGPRDILKLELSEEAQAEANQLAQAINILYKDFIEERGLPKSPEQPNADGLSIYHEKRMENPAYAKAYNQFEKDITTHNNEIDVIHKQFEKKYGINPDHFDDMSLEYGKPEDHVWSIIYSVARTQAHAWYDKINASTKLTKQRGVIDIEAIASLFRKAEANPRGGVEFNNVVDGVKMAGESVRRLWTGESPPKVDTVLTPRSPENIAQKEAMARKAAAIDLRNSPYERVTTIEEALTDPGPDISSNAVRNSVTPGVQSMVRHTTRNKLLKFARDVVYNSRNRGEEFSKTFVTDNENGMASALKDATPEEQMRVHQILEETSKQKVDLTPEMIAQLELSPREAKLLETTRAMLDGMYTLANEAYTKQGFSPLKKHPGYSPDMFSGAYTTILRVPKAAGEKSGKVLVAQADTKYGMNKAVEYYKQNFPDHTEIVELPRRGLKETAQRTNRVFDGFQKLISVIAENNPDFAEMKKLADDYAANNIKQMYQFQVHQKTKTGARGSLGDRPWLDAKENSQQFWKGVIDYAEEGSRYYSYQDALNELGKMQTNPELQASHPNTLAYLKKYSDNLQGKGLNIAGALGNSMVDLVPKVVGVSPRAVSVPLSVVRRASSVVMMGGVNLGFMAMQMTQLFTGGMPEMVKIGTTLGLGPKDITGVFTTLNTSLAGLVLEGKNNKASFVPEHMRNGWEWAKQHGIFDLNETVLAGEALKSGFWRNAEKAATFPMWASEKLTRPPVFMLFTDMFHRAGFEQETAFKKAQEATDYAMANYHPDERAMLYSSLGTLGNQMSALTVFKHNLLDQWYTRMADVKKGEIAPALAMVGMGYALYGMSGMPGYQEADQLTQWATGKTIRDVMGDAVGAGSKVMDGVLSATTGLDFSSKLSMASILPDDKLSAFPHISNIAKILGAAVDYASRLDKASGEQLAYQLTPSGMRGMLEQPMRNDQGFVLDKHGNRKYEVPRTDAEWKWRQAMGVRPLHERVSDEQDWAHEKEWKRKEQKQKDAGNNLQDAIKLRDKESVMKYVKEYVDAGGDPSTFSDAWFQNVLVQSNLSQHQRLQGIPANNLKSINRYNAIP